MGIVDVLGGLYDHFCGMSIGRTEVVFVERKHPFPLHYVAMMNKLERRLDAWVLEKVGPLHA